MEEFAQGMSWLDWLFAAVVLWLVFCGFRRGFSGETGRLIGAALAFAFCFFGGRPLEEWTLSQEFFGGSQTAARLAFFAGMAVASVSIWLLARKIFADLLKGVVKQPWDAMLGGFIGGVKAILLICLACSLGMFSQNSDGEKTLERHSSVASAVAHFLGRSDAAK